MTHFVVYGNTNNGAATQIKATSGIFVINGDGSKITIDANGKNINGSKNGYIYENGALKQSRYFEDPNELLVR